MNVQWPLFLILLLLVFMYKLLRSLRANRFHTGQIPFEDFFFIFFLKNSSSTYILKHNQVFIHRHAIALLRMNDERKKMSKTGS